LCLDDASESLYSAALNHEGEALLRACVYHLGRLLAADFVFVGQLISESPETVRTRVVFERGQQVPDFTYPLKGSPCEMVVRCEAGCFSPRVAEQFPDDELLRQHRVEGYAGVPLIDPEGCPIGIMGALFCQPIQNRLRTLALIKLFAAFVTRELRQVITCP
jgi:GAF domain-containing protein